LNSQHLRVAVAAFLGNHPADDRSGVHLEKPRHFGLGLLNAGPFSMVNALTGACVQVIRSRECLTPRMKGFVRAEFLLPPNAGSLKRRSVKGSPFKSTPMSKVKGGNHEVYDHLGQLTRKLQSDACAIY
jgi:hypothetical protein